MSDIANLRIENLHPKKRAWRTDRTIFPEENASASLKKEIESTLTNHFEMIINPNCNLEPISHNGISHTDESSFPVRNPSQESVSQDTPLDFSVKTVNNSNGVHDVRMKTSDISTNRDNELPREFERPSDIDSDRKQSTVPIYHRKVTSSPVPIYNGISKHQRTKQRQLNGYSSPSHISSQSTISPYSNKERIQSPPQEMTGMYNITEHQYQDFNHEMQQLHEKPPFDADRPKTPQHSPKKFSRNSPEIQPYANSILHDVLARPGDRSKVSEMNSYFQMGNTSSPCPKPLKELLAPSYTGTNSVLQTNFGMPDTDSIFPGVKTLIPTSNHFLPAPNFALVNGMNGMQWMNAMNSLGNGSLLSPTLDMLQTKTHINNKHIKPRRPFKAVTDGMLHTMPVTLRPMNQIMPNGGYYKEYTHVSAKDSSDSPKTSPVYKKASEMPVMRAINSSPPCSSNGTESKPDVAGSGDSNCSYTDATTSAIETAEATSNSSNNSRKRGRTLPEEFKDEAYWERRRKNNEAAKRSRDARRQKEDMLAQQACALNEHNFQLSFQMKTLAENYEHIKIQNQSLTEQCRNLQLQLQLMNDKIVRSRCGKCGSRLENDSVENGFGDSNKIE